MAGLLGAFPEAVAADAFVLGGDFNTWVRGRREGACKLARKQFPHPEKLDLRPTHHFEIGGWCGTPITSCSVFRPVGTVNTDASTTRSGRITTRWWERWDRRPAHNPDVTLGLP